MGKFAQDEIKHGSDGKFTSSGGETASSPAEHAQAAKDHQGISSIHLKKTKEARSAGDSGKAEHHNALAAHHSNAASLHGIASQGDAAPWRTGKAQEASKVANSGEGKTMNMQGVSPSKFAQGIIGAARRSGGS